jgi:hypothetical protein
MGTWGAALQQIGASKVADLLMMELAISCKPGSSELRLHFKVAISVVALCVFLNPEPT